MCNRSADCERVKIMARKITVDESYDKNPPAGYSWKFNGRARGYSVRSSNGPLSVKHEDFPSLTEARKHARAIVRGGLPWAEVFRWAESGTGIKKVFIASYEVEIESGSAIA